MTHSTPRPLARFPVLAPFFSLVLASLLVVNDSALAEPRYVPGEIIVRLRGEPHSARNQAFAKRATSMKGMRLRRSWQELNMHHLSIKAGDDLNAKLSELRADPEVVYAEPNYILTKASVGGVEGSVESSEQAQARVAALQQQFEQALAQQSVSAQTSGSYGLSGADIHAAEAWPVVRNDNSYVVVAIIDTGLDMNHTVFTSTGAVWTNPSEIANNHIDDDVNGYVDDVHGWNWAYANNNPSDDDSHGTHVAGIILGTTQPIFTSISSPLPSPARIRIMPLKFLDSNGSGSVSNAVQAIYYAVNNGAKVLNNSWGGASFSTPLQDAIAFAYSRQVVFVAAAGNYSSNNDTSPIYPASYDVPNILSVAATDSSDFLAYFSNFGVRTVHVAAPGVSIYSTLPGSTYGYLSGTSMATPFISGMAALIARERPTMTSYQIASLIKSSATHINGLANKVMTAARADSLASVQAAQAATLETSQPSYVSQAGPDTGGSSDRGPASATGGCGLVVSQMQNKSDDDPFSGANLLHGAVVAVLVLIPLLTYLWLRRQAAIELELAQPVQRRRYERYRVDSKVRLRVGDRELVGAVTSVSLGGVQLNTEMLLQKGGSVTMMIQAPDGSTLQVEGQVVWSAAEQSYGVKFADAQEAVMRALRQLTLSAS